MPSTSSSSLGSLAAVAVLLLFMVPLVGWCVMIVFTDVGEKATQETCLRGHLAAAAFIFCQMV